jgi:predicted SAM-dependent methyltransferase
MHEHVIGFRIRANEANMSSPRPEARIRDAFESVKIRSRYALLPPELFNLVFQSELALLNLGSSASQSEKLAAICIASNDRRLERLGLELLWNALPSNIGIPHAELNSNHARFIRETGRRDVFNSCMQGQPSSGGDRKRSLEQAESHAPGALLPTNLRTPFKPPEWDLLPPIDGLKLHLGCGPHILPGWRNLDLDPVDGASAWNAQDGLPFPTGVVSFIFSEHFIEHLSLAAAVKFLDECARVLCPNGIMRVATPDLEHLIQTYQLNRLEEWHDVNWAPRSRADMMNEGMRLWGHQYIYDHDCLESVLVQAGFARIQRAPWRQSTIGVFVNCEQRPYHHELIFEAQRSQ